MRERRKLAAQQEAIAARERAVDVAEAKLKEAQGRLASEWEHLHVDRAAYEALAADLVHKQAELAASMQRLMEDSDWVGRQRVELANQAGELAEFKQRLAFEWQQLVAERNAGFSDHQANAAADNEPVAPPNAPWFPDGALPPSDHRHSDHRHDVEDADPTAEAHSAEDVHPAEFDPLESVRHNKVFLADRLGTTLVVMPLGDASEFHYGDVHVESNKVRRLLEAGTFQNLVVDLGDAPVYSAVTINVVVQLSRIASNRGGRAVLCRASDKTRGLLQTMKLLDVWPLFENRNDAFEALSAPPQT